MGPIRQPVPKSLDHKFITEDVPTGLIPMSALGAAAGVGTPAINALVEVVRIMTGTLRGCGGTLELLGRNGMDGQRIRRVMEEGLS
jgi:opine dehydrogenase